MQRRRIRRDRGVGNGSFSGIEQLCSRSAAGDRLVEVARLTVSEVTFPVKV